MKKIKCAIFDLDGTLIDSMPVWHQVDLEFLASIGEEFTEEFGKRVKSMSFEESAGYIKEKFHLNRSVQQIMNELFALVRFHYENDIWLKPGVDSSLSLFRQAGIKMYIATANHIDISIASLKRNGIYDLFDGVVSCDEVGQGKRESPAIFYHAMELAGTDKEDTIVVEDSYHAIQTSAKAGFSTIAVYDKNSLPEIDMIKKTADLFFDDFYGFYRYFKNNDCAMVKK